MVYSRGYYSLLGIAIVVGSFMGPTKHETAAMWSWLQGDQSESAQQYREGREALDREDWDAAIRAFEKAREDESRADAALYWIAYAQNKKGNAAPALETIEALKESYPDSRWVREARALEMEIGGPSRPSRPPRGPRGSEDEDLELKLMALNSLMHADEEEAVPLLEQMLQGDHPTKLKERALFVLAQSSSARAQEVVAGLARDDSNSELQEKAIKYMGIHGGSKSLQLLGELYETVQNKDAKKAILHSFMVADEEAPLLEAARNEQDLELRGAAIHWLGVMDAESELWDLYQRESSDEMKEKILHALFIGDGSERLLAVARDKSESEDVRLQAIHWLGVSDATDELWALYQDESSIEVKKRILHGLFLSDDTDKLAQIARNGSEEFELRKEAIHNLGLVGDESRPMLLEIYNTESDLELKKQVLHALFLDEADTELIDIARRETDRELKKTAVHWLSLIDSKASRDFLMEILNK